MTFVHGGTTGHKERGVRIRAEKQFEQGNFIALWDGEVSDRGHKRMKFVPKHLVKEVTPGHWRMPLSLAYERGFLEEF